MKRPNLAEMLKNGESCYSLVMGISKRAREISESAQQQGIMLEKKPVQLAIEEYDAGKFKLIEVEGIGVETTF